MKIVLDLDELMAVLRKSFPPELIPRDHKLESIEPKGYPVREYEITVKKEEPAP